GGPLWTRRRGRGRRRRQVRRLTRAFLLNLPGRFDRDFRIGRGLDLRWWLFHWLRCDFFFDFLFFLEALDRLVWRGVGHHFLGAPGHICLWPRRRDGHRRNLDHDRGSGLRWLDLVAPVHHSRGDPAVRQHDDRAADEPAAQVRHVFGAQYHHGPGGFSSPTNAAFK